MNKIKITALIFAIMFVCAALVSCGKDKDGVPSGMIEVGGELNTEYRLFVPNDWTVDIATGFVSAHAQDGSNVSVQVVSTGGVYTSSADYIVRIDNETYNGLTEYFEKVYLPTIQTTFASLTLDEQYTQGQKLGDEERACKYVYSVTSGGKDYKIMQILAVHGSEIYIFTYTAREPNYDKHLEEVNDKILQNFIFR
ncbi:MAG: hypothetical protein IJR55_02270 [Clostridia bacterium]|nr:hypothetical protein [Clostridia bacterium]